MPESSAVAQLCESALVHQAGGYEQAGATTFLMSEEVDVNGGGRRARHPRLRWAVWTWEVVLPMALPLEGLKTSRIVTSLQQLGYMGQFMTGVRPLTPANAFVGRARTLRLLPTRPDVVKAMNADRSRNPNRVAVDQTQPGDVLVIDARGVSNHAVGGDPFAARVKGAGGVAFVTDGAVRNLPGLLALNFPIYAQGVHSSSLTNAHVGVAVNEPIACGGVLVMPGDIVVGDAEGVVVVPAELEAQVAEMSRASEAVDAYSIELLLQGVPMDEAYPLNPARKAEFEARQTKS